VLNGFKGVLAEILAKATAEGNFVSPRTAVHAFQVCQAAALLRGGDHVQKEDMVSLRFVPGLEGLADTIQADLTAAMERAEAEKRLVEAEAKLSELLSELDAANSPIKAMQAAKRFVVFQDEVSGLKVTDNLSERRKQLRTICEKKISEAQRKALEETRI
jgi:hypothetical protein